MLKEGLLRKVELLLRRNIRKILQIKIDQAIKERIKNNSIRQKFFNIATIKINCMSSTYFLGKVIQNTDDQLPAQLLITWCNHHGKERAGFLQSNKKSLVQNIQLIILAAAKDGLLASWVYLALDKVYWTYLVSLLGNTPIPHH